jgi:hypothetical protein
MLHRDEGIFIWRKHFGHFGLPISQSTVFRHREERNSSVLRLFISYSMGRGNYGPGKIFGMPFRCQDLGTRSDGILGFFRYS